MPTVLGKSYGMFILGYGIVDSRQMSPKVGRMLPILDLISQACLTGCEQWGINNNINKSLFLLNRGFYEWEIKR